VCVCVCVFFLNAYKSAYLVVNKMGGLYIHGTGNGGALRWSIQRVMAMEVLSGASTIPNGDCAPVEVFAGDALHY
jgi:hypothetical protein